METKKSKQPTCRDCSEAIEWLWNHLNQRFVPANPGTVQHTGAMEWVLVQCGFSHRGVKAVQFSKSAQKGDSVYVPHKCKNRTPKPKPLPEYRNEEYSLF